MTNFFEFFFSGPNWGWRLFGLIWLITVIGDVIAKLVKVILNYKVDKFKVEIGETLNHLKYPDNKKTETKNNPATIDDFRQ